MPTPHDPGARPNDRDGVRPGTPLTTAMQADSRRSQWTLADVFFRFARPIYDWMYRRGAHGMQSK